MPVNLSESLQAAGYKEGTEQFRKLVVNLKAVMYPTWTVDYLLLNPRDSELLCQVIRLRTGCDLFPSHIILGTLLNSRKQASRIAKRGGAGDNGQGGKRG